jgi:sugar lactone lactonase YvrE
MVRRLSAELLAETHASLGEAPLWDAHSGNLVWVDIFPGIVHVTSAAGLPVATYPIGHPVGSAMPADGAGWLLADANGFSRLHPDGRMEVVLSMLANQPDVRFNDAKCDPKGRAWAGTVTDDMAPGTGALYRLDPGPVATKVLDGLTVSNGIGWSPDHRTFWFSDSSDPYVRGFDYDLATGELGVRRHAIEITDTAGVADGLCVDDEGAIWLGIWGGSAIHRYTPDGRLDTIIEVRASQVTSCAFGGATGTTLFITTARIGLTPEQLEGEPHAGDLFVVEPGVSGPAATPWHMEAHSE